MARPRRPAPPAARNIRPAAKRQRITLEVQHINLATKRPKGEAIALEVETSATIDSVKAMWCSLSRPPGALFKVPEALCRLSFAGQQLEGGRALSDYGIAGGSTLAAQIGLAAPSGRRIPLTGRRIPSDRAAAHGCRASVEEGRAAWQSPLAPAAAASDASVEACAATASWTDGCLEEGRAASPPPLAPAAAASDASVEAFGATGTWADACPEGGRAAWQSPLAHAAAASDASVEACAATGTWADGCPEEGRAASPPPLAPAAASSGKGRGRGWQVGRGSRNLQGARSRLAAGREVRISRTMSWVLRHGAEKRGLFIRSDGFVNAQELLALREFAAFTVEDIKHVVRTNDKKRFELVEEAGEVFVRASQGHSMEQVEDEQLLEALNQADPSLPSVCVRGTYSSCVQSILQNGILAGGGTSMRKHVHFVPFEPWDERPVSGMKPDCDAAIYVNLREAMQGGIRFFRSSNNVLLSPGVVPAKYISKVLYWQDGAWAS